MRKLFTVVCLVLMSIDSVNAQTAYPMLMSLKPTAAQVGQTSEHTVNSRYDMFGAYKIVVSGTGVTGEVLLPEVKKGAKPPTLTKLKVKFTVTQDALPGVREFRIATPRGASTIGQLAIVRDAVVVESGKNNTAETANEIAVPSTVCGTVESNEDVDYFKFKVDAGKTLSFHMRSMRLQDKIHDLQRHSDPMITLRNSTGSTIAANDNYFYGDPFISHTFKDAGEYFLEVRDVRYHGNTYWEYSVEVSDQPFVTNVFPMAVNRGTPAKLQLVSNQPETTTSVTVPMETQLGATPMQLPLGDTVTNPVPVVVSDLRNVIESDTDNNAPENAQAIGELPAGINGRIESPADLDYFAFDAKKGEKYSFEVMARRWQSGLDSNLRILSADAKRLTENDDLKLYKHSFADSWIENWSVPADGKYLIEIRDLHLGGGKDFVYFIKATKTEPYFELYIDTDKTQLYPGTSGVIFANVVRKNGFEGEVQLHVEDLPAGVTATCGRVLSGKARDGCIVLQADAGAKIDMTNIRVWGSATHPMGDGMDPMPLEATAVAYQETYQPGGGRGHWPVSSHAVCITEPCDIRSLKLSTNEITLKKGESAKVEITIERAKGFAKNVQLDALYRHLSSTYANTLPAGVTIDSKKSKTLLTGKLVKGHIVFTASDKVEPVEKQQVSIMANISLNFVMKSTYCSQPLFVTISE